MDGSRGPHTSGPGKHSFAQSLPAFLQPCHILPHVSPALGSHPCSPPSRESSPAPAQNPHITTRPRTQGKREPIILVLKGWEMAFAFQHEMCLKISCEFGQRLKIAVATNRALFRAGSRTAFNLGELNATVRAGVRGWGFQGRWAVTCSQGCPWPVCPSGSHRHTLMSTRSEITDTAPQMPRRDSWGQGPACMQRRGRGACGRPGRPRPLASHQPAHQVACQHQGGPGGKGQDALRL